MREMVRRRTVATVLAAGLLVCGLAAPAPVGTRAAAAASGTATPTVWLCRPGMPDDPCTFSTATTAVSASGATSTPAPVTAPRASSVDCFYVYPTVSSEQRINADLQVQPVERAVAVVQASPFSQVCRVWAPVYRQVTRRGLLAGLGGGSASAVATASSSLLVAWRDYLAHDNHGRPIVFIGHSQGAAMLIRLLRTQVDPSPGLRRRTVLAILLGGNVQVPTGRTVGGSFRHLPTCSARAQRGCVIAYSTFGSTPPANAFFGRPGLGVSLQSGQPQAGGQQVACVNPVTFSSAPGGLQPLFVARTAPVPGVAVATPWVTFPGLYTGQCDQGAGATWLQVSTPAVPGDPRPTVTEQLGPRWGYHQQDVNLALGDLVADVAAAESGQR